MWRYYMEVCHNGKPCRGATHCDPTIICYFAPPYSAFY